METDNSSEESKSLEDESSNQNKNTIPTLFVAAMTDISQLEIVKVFC